MARRMMLGLLVGTLALLATVAPALAGGWAVVTLDALPREARAGQAFQIGFMVRQHGKTPTNWDLNSKPLRPSVIAQKQAAAGQAASANGEQLLRFAARQSGTVGHYVADVTLPSDGVWEWQIEVPTYYIQDNPNGENSSAAIQAPLTVLPAIPEPAGPAPILSGGLPAMLRWAGAILLLLAFALALFRRGWPIGRRAAAEAIGNRR